MTESKHRAAANHYAGKAMAAFDKPSWVAVSRAFQAGAESRDFEVEEMENERLSRRGAILALSDKLSARDEEIARLREALEFGLNVMMPEIHAQKTCWPGEVDDFEDRARKALGEEEK